MSAAAQGPSSRPKPSAEGTVPLGSLPIEQLEKLQADLQREVDVLTASLAQRTDALQRMAASKDNARAVKGMAVGDPIMVPLTGSVYVPGLVADTAKVLVDLGTGFFVEKTPDAAESFFARRAAVVKDESDKASAAHTVKRQQLEAVNAVLQRKVVEAQRRNAAKARAQ